MLKDVQIDMINKTSGGMGTAGGVLYFEANKTELWKSDGTEAGTLLVKNLHTGNSDFTPTSFLDVGGIVYFRANDWGERPVLWRSDGTAEGTNMVDSGLRPGLLPYLKGGPWLIQTNQVLFSGYTPCMGSELQRIDEAAVQGGQAHAVVVKDIETKTNRSEFDFPVEFRGKFVFTATDGKGASGLWSSDGSESGTRPIINFNWAAKIDITHYYEAVEANGLLFFTIHDQGMQLYRTDGTETGVLRLTNFQADYHLDGPHSLTAYRNNLYFFNDAPGYEELWVSDGSPTGTRPLLSFGQAVTSAGRPVLLNGWLYFLAFTSGHQLQLYRSDGTPAGTVVLKSWQTNGISVDVRLIQAGSKLFFTAWDADHGRELWASDGTPQGTRLVWDLTPGSAASDIRTMVGAGNSLFFTSQSVPNSWVLWKVAGPGSAPSRLLDGVGSAANVIIPPGQGGGRYVFFTSANYMLRTLWRSDGTPEGTIPLKPENGDYFTQNEFAVLGDLAYFNATDTEHGAELWVSDGTPAGTHLAFDLLPGPASSNPERLAFVNGALWFCADDGLHGSEPWIYDFMTRFLYLPVIGR